MRILFCLIILFFFISNAMQQKEYSAFESIQPATLGLRIQNTINNEFSLHAENIFGKQFFSVSPNTTSPVLKIIVAMSQVSTRKTKINLKNLSSNESIQFISYPIVTVNGENKIQFQMTQESRGIRVVVNMDTHEKSKLLVQLFEKKEEGQK